ncbi:MAG: response regulator [Leptolyngbyaceae cyanobacterium HOT.MB2.61]|nr:response regulator [Leptolyngbyaceae cyanobacterium HOT.MB2.61]
MSKTVLVVDDEEDVRAIARLGLEMGANWNVLTASSGQEAVAMAATHQPDVILLDMMMPDMDGRATLQQLQANPTTQPIPVILVTAKVQQCGQDSFADMGVAAVFAKPFRPLKLAEQIKEALGWGEG